MRYIIPSSTLLATLLSGQPVQAQNWTQGTPVNFLLSELSINSFGCFPSADREINFPVSAVTGVAHIAIVTAVTPAGTNYIVPGPSAINVGDTIHFDSGVSRACFFPSGNGSLTLEFFAVGTPTVSGQVHPCTFNAFWLSNLLLCPDGLSVGITNNCTVQPGSLGVAPPTATGPSVVLPSAANGWTLSVQGPEVRSLEIINAVGAQVARVEGGSLVCRWPNGVYFARIATDAGTRVERVVVRR